MNDDEYVECDLGRKADSSTECFFRDDSKGARSVKCLKTCTGSYSEVEEFIAFLPFTGNGTRNNGLKLQRIKLGLM